MTVTSHTSVTTYTIWRCDGCGTVASPLAEPGPPIGWTRQGRDLCTDCTFHAEYEGNWTDEDGS